MIRRGLLALVLTLPAGAALADRIDGEWCSPDGLRHVRINGPQIETPGGQNSTGDYERHAFTFTIPEGESDAGTVVQMHLLGETAVRVWFGLDDPVVWGRCRPVS